MGVGKTPATVGVAVADAAAMAETIDEAPGAPVAIADSTADAREAAPVPVGSTPGILTPEGRVMPNSETMLLQNTPSLTGAALTEPKAVATKSAVLKNEETILWDIKVQENEYVILVENEIEHSSVKMNE
jgi:hypothetical protein